MFGFWCSLLASRGMRGIDCEFLLCGAATGCRSASSDKGVVETLGVVSWRVSNAIR